MATIDPYRRGRERLPRDVELRHVASDLGRGGAVGGAGGLVLGVVTALSGYPEWALVVWGALTAFGVAVLPLLLGIRLLTHLTYVSIEKDKPRERRLGPGACTLGLLRPFDRVGAALLAPAVVLLVFWAAGGGRSQPF